MAASRKVYTVKGVAGTGGSFRVGTIVKTGYGAPGIIVRILPAHRGDEGLGPRAWVAYDVRGEVRRWPRPPEMIERLGQEVAGRCRVVLTYLYTLKPIGQAKRLPKCVISTRPTALHRAVEGRWARASRPPRRKTPRERREETQTRLKESERKARSSREGFPLYKPSKFVSPAKVAEDYERYAFWERRAAKDLHAAIGKYNAKGALRRQWLAEAHAHERRAARAERIVARLRGHHLILEAHKSVSR